MDQFNRLARGLGAATQQSVATAQGDASREVSRGIKEQNKLRELNKYDSILGNNELGLYTTEEMDNGAFKKTLRSDWKDQLDNLQSLYPDEFGDMIGYDSLIKYIGEEDGEPVSKRNKKVYGPLKRQGVPSSVQIEAEDGSESAIEAAKTPQDIYMIPVQNQEGLFSFKTRFGTDKEDDEPLKFSAKELEMYLSIVLPEMMEIQRDPSGSRVQSNLQGGSFDLAQTGQDGVSFTEYQGGSQESVVGLLNKDSVQEVAMAFMDSNVSVPDKVSLLASLTKEYNKNPIIKSSPGASDTSDTSDTVAPTATQQDTVMSYGEEQALQRVTEAFNNPDSGKLNLTGGAGGNAFKDWYAEKLGIDSPGTIDARNEAFDKARNLSDQEKYNVAVEWKEHLENKSKPGTGPGLKGDTTSPATTDIASDPITLSLTDAIPELQGISTDEEVRKVIENIGIEELSNRGLGAESVTNIQTIMSEQGINDSEELKKAVEDTRVKNPYVVSTSLALILQDENGMIMGQPVKEWADEYFNYITSGVKNKDNTAMLLTNAMLDRESQEIARERLLIDDAANKNASFSNRLKSAEFAFKKYENRVANVLKLSEDSMTYLSDPEENKSFRAKYVQFNAEFKSLINSTATTGRDKKGPDGKSDYQVVEEYWNATPLGEAGIKMTEFDYFRIASGEVENVGGLNSMRYEIAADNIRKYLTTNWVPNFGVFVESDWQDWLDDFKNPDEEKGASVLAQESLVLVRNAQGVPYKIAGKSRSGTVVVEAELSRFIEDLTKGNKIRLEDLSILMQILPSVGDEVLTREKPGEKQRRDKE